MPRTFYRIVKTNRPTAADFSSYLALGIPFWPDDEEARSLASGISVFATEQQARNRRNAIPSLGAYIAAIEIPDGAPLRVERTGRGRGHHTIWADPAYVRSCVVSVVPA